MRRLEQEPVENQRLANCMGIRAMKMKWLEKELLSGEL